MPVHARSTDCALRLHAIMLRLAVGIFGGAFDPPTHAHLTAACEAVASGLCDEVWLTPCAGLRQDKDIRTPFHHRVRLLELLLRDSGAPGAVKVSSLERKYATETQPERAPAEVASLPTAQLFSHLRAEHGNSAKFALVCGSDVLGRMPGWYRGKEVLETVPLLVFGRPEDGGAGVGSPTSAVAAEGKSEVGGEETSLGSALPQPLASAGADAAAGTKGRGTPPPPSGASTPKARAASPTGRPPSPTAKHSFPTAPTSSAVVSTPGSLSTPAAFSTPAALSTPGVLSTAAPAVSPGAPPCTASRCGLSALLARLPQLQRPESADCVPCALRRLGLGCLTSNASSTEARRRLAVRDKHLGLRLAPLITPSMLKYIEEHKLYEYLIEKKPGAQQGGTGRQIGSEKQIGSGSRVSSRS